MVLLDAVEGGFLPYPWKLLPRDLPHHLGECRPARANTQPDQPLLNAIYARDLARGREPALDDPRPKSPSGRLLFRDADLPNIGIGHSVFGVFVVVSISRYKNILLPVGEEGLLLPAAADWRGSGPTLDARERCRTDRGRGQRRAGAAPLVTSRVPNYALACA